MFVRTWMMAASLGVLLSAAGCGQSPSVPLGALPTHRLDLNPPPRASVVTTPAPRIIAPRPVSFGPRDAWAVAQPRGWHYIVIHHSATEDGNADEFDLAHRQRGWDELGYHFVITNGSGGPDGTVQVGSRWPGQKWGAHCGNTPNNEYNEYGIGICLVGNFSRRRPTRTQLASLERLVSHLAERFDIPPENVIGHHDAPNARTACPGQFMCAYITGPLYRALHTQLAASK